MFKQRCRYLIGRVKADAKKVGLKKVAKRMRMPYRTLYYILIKKSTGTMKTWQKIERIYDEPKS